MRLRIVAKCYCNVVSKDSKILNADPRIRTFTVCVSTKRFDYCITHTHTHTHFGRALLRAQGQRHFVATRAELANALEPRRRRRRRPTGSAAAASDDFRCRSARQPAVVVVVVVSVVLLLAACVRVVDVLAACGVVSQVNWV